MLTHLPWPFILQNIGSRELATNGDIIMGAVSSDTLRYFVGRIACLQVFDTALSQDKIVDLMNCTLGTYMWAFIAWRKIQNSLLKLY